MSSSVPSISAVIPVRDGCRTIGRAVESVLAQAQRAQEVIVVDDGSTDDLAGALSRFGAAVNVLRRPGAGAAAARNRGVQAARGDWIAFLDSDDVWLPKHLESISRSIVSTGAAASLYFADIRRPPSEGARLLWETCDFRPPQDPWFVPDATAWVMKPRQPMMLQTSVIRRTTFLAMGGLDCRLVRRHDTHLFFRLGLGAPVCAVNGCGGEMSDDAGRARLTVTFDSHSRVYWNCTAILYRDILQSAKDRPGSVRHELRDRLAAAELRLARFAASGKSYLSATAHLARALQASPARVIQGVRRRLAPAKP